MFIECDDVTVFAKLTQLSEISIMLTFLTLALITIVHGDLVGPVVITENGKQVTRYAVSGWTGGASTNGNKVIIDYDGRVEIAINPTNNYSDPNMYVEYKLTGKTLTWTSDLSQVGCSCNAGIFFSTMPGYKTNGSPDAGPISS